MASKTSFSVTWRSRGQQGIQTKETYSHQPGKISLDCKGLKGFFECDLESKRTTRSSVKGDLLLPTMKNIPSQGFRHQSVKLWNSNTSVDMQNAKITKMHLRTFPK
jgi:hypothetical protein